MAAKPNSTTPIRRIKAALAKSGGRKQPDIAKQFGVSRSLVSDIFTERRHSEVPWPPGFSRKPLKAKGQRKAIPQHDVNDERIQELESEVVHLKDELLFERKRVKAHAKSDGLFKAIAAEMQGLVEPFNPLPPALVKPRKDAITEDLVLHLSDMHADEVVRPEECGGLEEYNFPIACARAERYVDTVLEWTQDTLKPKFHFKSLWILSYGDQTSGEIHGHAHRSYYRNQFKNCFAIGQLQALMIRELAPHFEQVNVVCVAGNHGRRSVKKDYHGAQDNWDYLVAEIARMHCADLPNVCFTIPDAWSVNLIINGVGANVGHGDDVKGNLGIPFYGMVRKQKGLIALNSISGGIPIRYFFMGHHHTASTLADGRGEMMVNGAWKATDAFCFNSFASYREPAQWIHGMNPEHGITWRMNVKLKHAAERKGPKRYRIDGGRDVGPLAM